jgi:signal transduction histidine kinase
VVGADGRIEYANAAAGLSLSRSAEELVGKTPSEAGLSEGAAGFIEEMRSGKRRQRGSFEQREEGGAGEGPTVLRLTARPAKRGSVGRLYVTVDDVTQQRMADEARNALIASATHELRTPLTNIRLYVEEVIDAGEDDRESRAHALNVISKESRRLERIVTDLLSVAELESGSMRLNIDEIRLGDMLGELEGDFRQQAESKGIALRFDLPPKVPVISGDRDRFELVMHNLVGNALKYTDSGGRVDVRLEESGGHVEIAVSDTGMGIPEGECEKIFDRFFRAGDGRVKDIQGTGLGLTIAREIARRHGGDITVESVVGEGSVFTLRVPGGGARARAA